MTRRKKRSLLFLILSGIMIVLSAILVIAGVAYFQVFGWIVAIPMIAAGLVSIVLAVVGIIKNDPAWLILDLIIPG